MLIQPVLAHAGSFVPTTDSVDRVSFDAFIVVAVDPLSACPERYHQPLAEVKPDVCPFSPEEHPNSRRAAWTSAQNRSNTQ